MLDRNNRNISRWMLALLYLVASAIHLVAPETFLPVMPAWVPLPHQVILFTGLCEIAGAIGLLLQPTRWLAGVMLALYAICVFPVNVNHAMMGQAGSLPSSWWYHVPRLAFQPVLVWWALYSGKVIDWPFQHRAARGH